MADSPDITVGDLTYRIVLERRPEAWHARAVRADTGERFGAEASAATEHDAAARLAAWLEWQHEHTRALESLQQAERAYHRAIAGGAFGGADASAGGETGAALDAVDAARRRLDEVRGRRPAL